VLAPIERLVDAFPQDVRFVYRHFPLSDDPNSLNHLAVRAAEAAGAQQVFFDYHQLLLERQSEWSSLAGAAAVREQLIAYAAELKLDHEQFAADLDSTELADLAMNAFYEGVGIGLQGTPSVFLNESALNLQALGLEVEQWGAYIEAQKAVRALPQYEAPPMTISADKEYLATVETDKGTFVIELYAKSAPLTVNSFVFLTGEGWYDGVTFHRVITDFMAQTGDPSGTGMGGPGYTFEDEIDPELGFDGPGWVAMANAGSNTNGSQFFITYAEAAHLNGLYTIFGKVISGMDVVEALTPRDPQVDPDFEGDRIIKVTIGEK
jgi:cyclophilin family peptidyl-prolyl cis-trans isomerase